MSLRPFHLAIPVKDLETTRAFYVDVLGCKVGRRAADWLDLDVFGHQVTANLDAEAIDEAHTNPVDGQNVPTRHFGVILEWGEWEAMCERLKGAGVRFVIGPYIRFRGQVGEQATMFFQDPSGNVLEFKAFRNDSEIFRTA